MRGCNPVRLIERVTSNVPDAPVSGYDCRSLWKFRSEENSALIVVRSRLGFTLNVAVASFPVMLEAVTSETTGSVPNVVNIETELVIEPKVLVAMTRA